MASKGSLPGYSKWEQVNGPLSHHGGHRGGPMSQYSHGGGGGGGAASYQNHHIREEEHEDEEHFRNEFNPMQQQKGGADPSPAFRRNNS